jgi:multicomponent Na+:H+ antiporter subunit E
MSQTTTSPFSWLRYRRFVFQVLLLAAIWFILSGKLEAIYIFWAFVSIASVIWLSGRLRNIPLEENESSGATRIIIPRLIVYLNRLLWEIIKAGVYVAYLILHPRMPIQPMLVRFTSKQPNIFARVILGNSITLTPGTVTVDIEGSRFTVHALTMGTKEGLVRGGLQSSVARLYLDEFEEEDMCCDIRVITSRRGK